MQVGSALRRLLPDADKLLLRQVVAGRSLQTQHPSGCTVVEHLSRTRYILAAWQEPAFLQMAGLCHSLYLSERPGGALLPISDRARLQQLIGRRAEYLAYLFCAIKRGALFRAVSAYMTLQAADGAVSLEGDADMGPPLHLISRKDATHLLILHLANIAEQSRGHSGAPAVWLSRFASLSRTIPTESLDTLPHIFSALSEVTRYSELEALNLYLTANRHLRNAHVAIPLLEECVSIMPCLAEPALCLVYLKTGWKDPKARKLLLARPLHLLRSWGTSWDKRIPYGKWLEIANCSESSFAIFQDLVAAREPTMSDGVEMTSAI